MPLRAWGSLSAGGGAGRHARIPRHGGPGLLRDRLHVERVGPDVLHQALAGFQHVPESLTLLALTRDVLL